MCLSLGKLVFRFDLSFMHPYSPYTHYSIIKFYISYTITITITIILLLSSLLVIILTPLRLTIDDDDDDGDSNNNSNINAIEKKNRFDRNVIINF